MPLQRSATQAIISIVDGTVVLECVVRDFSATGARVDLTHKLSPTEYVYLIYPGRNYAHEATVVWCREKSLGLFFTAEIDLTKRDLPSEVQFLKSVASDHRRDRQGLARYYGANATGRAGGL